MTDKDVHEAAWVGSVLFGLLDRSKGSPEEVWTLVKNFVDLALGEKKSKGYDSLERVWQDWEPDAIMMLLKRNVGKN